MARILVVCSSPRKDANSEILADAVAEGARNAGAQVEKVRLAAMKLGFCTGCDACQKSAETPCVQKDDLTGLVERLRTFDGFVLASPIYVFSVCGQMKVFMDRLHSLNGGGDSTALKGKAAALVLTYGDSNALTSGVLNALGTFRDAFAFRGIRHVGTVHTTCDAPGEVRKNARALEEAHDVGRRLALFVASAPGVCCNSGGTRPPAI